MLRTAHHLDFSSADQYRLAIPALHQARFDLEIPHVIGAIFMIREAFDLHPAIAAIRAQWHSKDDVELVFELEAASGEFFNCHLVETALAASKLVRRGSATHDPKHAELLRIRSLFPHLSPHAYGPMVAEGMRALCHIDSILRNDAPVQHLTIENHGPAIFITRDMDPVQIADAIHAVPQVRALLESAALEASSIVPLKHSTSMAL